METCLNETQKLCTDNNVQDKLVVAEDYRLVVATLLSVFEEGKKNFTVDVLLTRANMQLKEYRRDKPYTFETLKQTENDRKKKQIRLNIVPKQKARISQETKRIKPKTHFVISVKEDNLTLDYPETVNTLYEYVKYLHNYVYNS